MVRRKEHSEFEILQIIAASPGTRALSLYNKPEGGDDWEEEPVVCFALCRWDLSWPEERGIANDGEMGLMIIEGMEQTKPSWLPSASDGRDALIERTVGIQAHIDRIRNRAKEPEDK